MTKTWWRNALASSTKCQSRRNPWRRRLGRFLSLERLDERAVLAVIPGVPTPNELVQSGFSADQLAAALVGGGVSISNATFTGGSTAAGSFTFTDPTVVGFGQGIVLSSGNVADIVGPNLGDSTSTDYANPGDADLSALSGFGTFDAAVLEFDFVPTANQVVFQYAFASDEYPEWVNTPFNDVFAFYVNGTNYATVRQIAGDPMAPFVPVAVNNINDGNPLDPSFVPARPDLFRPNYVDPNGGPSVLDLEQDGITTVLTFQAPVIPGVSNHMKLAIADASDGIYDSAVFIQSGSLVSNENPVADLSLLPQSAADPSKVTAVVEGEDPNGLPLTFTINWGDGTSTTGPLTNPTDESEKTTTVDHVYLADGNYLVLLTVSNGPLAGTSVEDVSISGVGGGGGNNSDAPVVVNDPSDQAVVEGETFTFTASATGNPAPDIQWQVSIDSGLTFEDIPEATQSTYAGVASLADNGNLYQAVFTNSAGEATTSAALLTVTVAPPTDVTPPVAPSVTLVEDTGLFDNDGITSVGLLSLADIEDGATVEYSVDDGDNWSTSFTAVEGENSVQVRQTDEAGNISDAALLAFLLDTQAPNPLGLQLTHDTGASAIDQITNDGQLTTTGVEADANVEYSVDGGNSWSDNFGAQEGLNAVQARQTDLAGNISVSTTLNFALDTIPPQLSPTFSSGTKPILVNAKGVTVAPNATDATGISSQSAGAVVTTSAGWKSVTCTATDLAGNSASVSVPYLVGYAAVNVTPLAGASFKKSASSITVSFKLQDANGLISDAVAATLAAKIVVSFDNQKFSGVTYNKKSDTFSLSLKLNKPTVGTHTVGIHVFVGSDEVTTVNVPIKIV